MDMTTENGTPARTEKATFGAGCFWQVEENFRQVPGVIDTAVGYEGGHVDDPTYEQVCTGTTGHTEVCEVTFDPDKVSFDELVAKYFAIHDPTQMNRQGPDVGFQYRSVVFAHSDEQAEIARKVIERTQERFSQPIVTVIEPAATFWRAEEYHQCYLEKRQSQGGLMGMLLGR
jgi:peptide-methionine (S)-S-oxide reductase